MLQGKSMHGNPVTFIAAIKQLLSAITEFQDFLNR